ncbi:MAG: hypothetical protein R6U31_02200 [bacterium]
MRKIIIIAVFIVIISAGCTDIKKEYSEDVSLLLEEFNRQINIMSNEYIRMIESGDADTDLGNVQKILYDIKLDLLSLKQPQDEEYRNFTSKFLTTIESFELLNYKISNYASLYRERQDIGQDGIKGFSRKDKIIKEKMSVTDNLIEIQREDIRSTASKCKYNLTDLAGSAVRMLDVKLEFPEFLISL